MSLSGTDNPACSSMTVASATSTTSFRACRFAVRAFLAPHFYFIFFGTLDSSLAHLSVVLDLCFRKLSVLPENDVEA